MFGLNLAQNNSFVNSKLALRQIKLEPKLIQIINLNGGRKFCIAKIGFLPRSRSASPLVLSRSAFPSYLDNLQNL